MATHSESEGAAPRADVLTAQEVADWMKVPVKTVYELAKDGRLPVWRVGKHYRFDRRAVVDSLLKGSKDRVALTR